MMNNTANFVGMVSTSNFVGVYLLMILGIVLGAWLVSSGRVTTVAIGVVIIIGVIVLFISTVTV